MTHTLPEWLQRLLGIETGGGEGTVWRLDYRWDLPPWLTLILIALGAAFVVVTYLRENPQSSRAYRLSLAAMRLGVLGIVLFMLAQFAVSLQRTGLPYVAVVVDDSLSMATADRYEDSLREQIARRARIAEKSEITRWKLAETFLTEDDGRLLHFLNDRYRLRLYYLTGARSSGVNEVDALRKQISESAPSGSSTRLGEGIRAVLDDLRGSPPAAMIVLSDGINTEGPGLPEAAAYARRKGVPLYFVGLGDDRPVRDVKLTDLLVDEIVFVNDVVYFEAKISAAGYEGRKAEIVLREKDKPGVLAKVEETLAADGQSQTVRLPFRPTEEGEFQYVVEVQPLEGELQTDNNRQQRTVRVRKEKIRVLLVQADPSYEYRYLRNMLARDNTIELKTVLQNADLEHAEQDAMALRGFPVSREELFEYDVLILSDPNPAQFSPSMLKNIADFVDQPAKGGALVCIAGPKFMPMEWRGTPLAPLLPVDAGAVRPPDGSKPRDYQVQPTDLGLASPGFQLGNTPSETEQIWRELPPATWMLDVPDSKPGARVLADYDAGGRRLPAILLQYVGAGKVLFHATDETWRWRWRVGDLYFARYWVQTIRWLVRSKLTEGDRQAALTADRREYRYGEPVRLRVRFADDRFAPEQEDGVTVILEHEGQSSRRVQLRRTAAGRGVFEAVVESPGIGSYHAWMAIPAPQSQAPAVDFTVLPPAGEFERLQMDAQEMQRAAEATKGRYYNFLAASQLLEDLPEGRQVPVESLPPVPLWNRWPVLLLLFALLIGEWLLRKLGGMV